MPRLTVTISAVLLAACVVSSIKETNWTQDTNRNQAAKESGAFPDTHEFDYQLSRLWQDKPEYVELITRKYVRRFRVVALVAPKYPYLLLINRVKAIVRVSFIIGVDGRDEDARILESSDSRFDSISIDTVREMKFIPAEGPAGPEREIVTFPITFAGRAAC